MIKAEHISKVYGKGAGAVRALDDVSFSVEKGEFIAVTGPSGSGKSTLLHILGGVDVPTGGRVYVNGIDVYAQKEEKLAIFRRRQVGLIYQFYNLVPNLTVRENIQVCEYLAKEALDMDELLETLGLTEHQNKFPSQLSGGQQQRCAIARALIKNPKLLLCDEPTGALDSKTSRDILALLEKVNEKYGTTMLIVTHNNSIKNMVHRVIRIKDGIINSEYTNETRVPAVELEDL